MEFRLLPIKHFSFSKRILTVLTLATFYIFLTNAKSTHIIGGSPASSGEFPYMVSIMVKHDNGSLQHFCGGTLVDYSYIVTAAHCVYYYSAIDVVVMAGSIRLSNGESTQQFRQVDEIRIHPQYSTRRNDIARLRVSLPFSENSVVSKVSFPPRNHIADGLCRIAGWGITTQSSGSGSNVLNKASLPIVPKNECYNVYQGEFDNSSQICAGLAQGGVDSCTGDTGGALICNYLEQNYFAGISSWGYLCAVPGYPGVYTEISKYIDWIDGRTD